MGQISDSLQKIVCLPIKMYQYLLSPFITPCCRFYPCCSEYALTAIKYHGIGKGIWLAARRILRCHPWSTGGYDPVLPKNKENY